jgi:hypothetical protein
VKYYFDNDAKVKKIHSDTDFKIYKDEEDDDEDED